MRTFIGIKSDNENLNIVEEIMKIKKKNQKNIAWQAKKYYRWVWRSMAWLRKATEQEIGYELRPC